MNLPSSSSLRAAVALGLCALAPAQSHDVYTYTGATAGETGHAVAGLGDVDGDGVGDFAIGRPFHQFGSDTLGRVEIHSGKTGQIIRLHYGEAHGDRYGWAIDGVGDMNHDGYGDYIIGAPYWDAPGITNCGKAYVISGKTGGFLWVVYDPQAGALTGHSVCGPGDVNGDGTPDYAIGIPNADENGLINCGRVVVESGASVGALWARDGVENGALFGWSMDAVGDLNGDGRAELAVGAPYEDVFTANNGRGYVLNGSNGGTLFSRFGAWANGHLGWSVAGVGDVNGDGVPDVAFGEPDADTNGADSGRVLVSSGAAPYLGLNEVSAPAGTHLGYAVAGIGDADGDGRADYACSAPYANFFGSLEVGWIYLVSGMTGASFQTLVGLSAGDRIGYCMDALGDLNGDGYADLIVGAPQSDVGGTNGGLARVILNKFPFTKTYCTAKQNSAGCTPEISATGTPSASLANNLFIRATSILKNVPGLLIWSYGSAAVPFGGGTLCLASPVFRTSGQTSGGSGGACSGNYFFHLSQGFMAAEGLQPGTLFHAQFWSRDNGFSAPNNMNLTDAIQVPIVQ